MPVSAVPTFNIEEASGGNAALRNLLTQLAQQAGTQIAKTTTSNKPAPKQATATVTFSNPFYVVDITNPESQSAASTQQAAQQTAAASIGANANLAIIYNQVRVARSKLFDAASDVQTYGGDSGTTQTQFVIPGLDSSLGWYFQVRSSFDGNTWNQWKTINSPADVNANGVSLQPVANGSYAMFELPGSQTVGFGVMVQFDQSTVVSGPGTSLQDSVGIVGPNGFTDTGHHAHGINAAGIDVNGVVSMSYADNDSNVWSGSGNCLLFGWGSTGQSAKAVAVSGGNFIVLTLPGGNKIAIGSGKVASGSAFGLPPGFSSSNCMAICSPASTYSTDDSAHGISEASVSGTTCTIGYSDNSGGNWSGDALWFAIAWSPALQANLVSVSDGQYLILHTPSGDIAIGMGSCASGSAIPLPSGYSFLEDGDIVKAIAFASPASYQETGNDMHGVQLCSVNQNGVTILVYEDGEGNQWSGNVNWFCMAWK